MLLEHLRHAIGHLNASASDKAIVVLFTERRLCHLTPPKDNGLLTQQEHWLDAGTRCARSKQVGPDVSHEPRDLRNGPDNHSIINLIPILEDRVISGPVGASLLARPSILIDGLQ